MCALSERVNLRVVGLLVLAGNVHYTGRKRGEDETWISYIGLPASNDKICSHQIYVGTFKVTQLNMSYMWPNNVGGPSIIIKHLKIVIFSA